MHTCCLLCHREFKDWGASSANGLPGSHGTKLADAVPALSQALLREAPGRKLADAVPSLSQSLLGEVPLWICQSCCKSVEEEERRSTLEQPTPVNKKELIWVTCLEPFYDYFLVKLFLLTEVISALFIIEDFAFACAYLLNKYVYLDGLNRFKHVYFESLQK